MSIVSALETLGVDWPDTRRTNRNRNPTAEYLRRNSRPDGIRLGGRGFWQRNEAHLDELAYEVRQGYLRAIKSAHPDHGHGEEQAKNINNAYQYIQRKLHERGIEA